ncbi:MAG TPA: glycoside hydrolase family 2 TIM barrel-domain containing protein [Bacteroidales bacterium]|jgi:beta-galactosidase|nr:glycoside hydrolase family 2 TIM barrel-domain containing protein [Bacteroidales bacterium]HPK30500.1 glycoside hydrolase family 2 TIM barrel-domain containing protein [Bacteroidales bacterium]
MKKYIPLALLLSIFAAVSCHKGNPRSEILLEEGWKFSIGDFDTASDPAFDDSEWQEVRIPHDWAIYGPFERSNDLQVVAVRQNDEIIATEITGRTGGLPYVGVGWYRTEFDLRGFDGEKEAVSLLFDGAMSGAQVWVNGTKVITWPLGYNSFHCDITQWINEDGEDNSIAVRLENLPKSSRWYPGAGLYRNVRLVRTSKLHIPIWGTYITTPEVSRKKAEVSMQIAVEGSTDKELRIVTEIRNPKGKKVAYSESLVEELNDQTDTVMLRFTVRRPDLWSPESPALYTAHTTIYEGDLLTDSHVTRFGIRYTEVVEGKGFYLNGESRKFKGVCNHHDLGPLGAAVNKAALRHQLEMLKDMGCDAIRTSHNMPAPELVDLCDEMGFMLIVEAFDEWDIAKCTNGYHLYFEEWAEKDMVNMIRNFRNNPSVVMWSIGNEVPTQCDDQGYKVAAFLQSICHREDPSRLVTCGMDQVQCVLANGFAQLMDVVGLNYRTHIYKEAFETLPQGNILGSETSSTVSSRGVYKFPVALKAGAKYDDHQSSSYDVEYCSWSNIPDVDFALAEDFEWTMGQFAWTGFDYLGEPTPYDTDSWPNHSSLFGIIDLASIPKDRYYLYRSQWNENDNTLHLLPHWNWEGREGETIPVMCYTDYPSAELFVNGVSQGVVTKGSYSLADIDLSKMDKDALMARYRLIWPDVVYQPGEIEVVAYNAKGREQMRKRIVTAGEPHAIVLEANRNKIEADGRDLAYVYVSIVDKDGNLCPNASNEVRFEVKGAGEFVAVANGDPTCLYPFHEPIIPAFSGRLTAIVTSHDYRGSMSVKAFSEGLEPAQIIIKTN